MELKYFYKSWNFSWSHLFSVQRTCVGQIGSQFGTENFLRRNWYDDCFKLALDWLQLNLWMGRKNSWNSWHAYDVYWGASSSLLIFIFFRPFAFERCKEAVGTLEGNFQGNQFTNGNQLRRSFLTVSHIPRSDSSVAWIRLNEGRDRLIWSDWCLMNGLNSARCAD